MEKIDKIRYTINHWDDEQKKESPENKIRGAAFERLSICINQSDPDIEFYFLTMEKRSRESLIKEMIFDSNANDKLGNIFKKAGSIDEAGISYLHFLSRWFMNRYDLKTATQLMIRGRFRSNGVQQFIETTFSFLKWIITLLALLMMSEMICGVKFIGSFFLNWMGRLSYGQAIPWVNIPPGLFQKLEIQNSISVSILFSLYILASATLLYRIIRGLHRWLRRSERVLFKPYWQTLLIPRLFAGILIGYFPLLFASDVWKLAFNLQGLPAIISGIGSLALCWIYLNTEINNRIPETKERSSRVLQIFIIGVVESFLLGVVLTDIIALPIIKELLPDMNNSIYAFYGLFGIIIPKVILVFFPMALLIGIVVQIIWEDKPITHPL
jgi:hypothetical protein